MRWSDDTSYRGVCRSHRLCREEHTRASIRVIHIHFTFIIHDSLWRGKVRVRIKADFFPLARTQFVVHLHSLLTLIKYSISLTHLLQFHCERRDSLSRTYKMKFFILAVVVGVVAAQRYQDRQNQQQYQEPEQRQQAPSDRNPSTTTYIPILQWNKEQEHDGTYRTSYETGNNIVAEESGYIKTLGEGDDKVESLVQQGSYSYTSPEGQIITVHYTADETGFHATGDHLPTPPPVSEDIQKGLDLIYAGIHEQEANLAREASLKAQQPFNQVDRREDEKKYRQ